jgi:hypothetical protein
MTRNRANLFMTGLMSIHMPIDRKCWSRNFRPAPKTAPIIYSVRLRAGWIGLFGFRNRISLPKPQNRMHIPSLYLFSEQWICIGSWLTL